MWEDHFLNKETEITNRIRLHLTQKFPGIVLWRNNLGFDNKTKCYYGIGNPGGADLIGMYRGRFVALEIKTPGAYTKKEHLAEQTNFIRVIKEGGGLAGFAHSPEEAEEIIRS